MKLKGIFVGMAIGLILTILSYTLYKMVTEDSQIVPFQWDEIRLEYIAPGNYKTIWSFNEEYILVSYPNSSRAYEHFNGHWANNKTFVVDRDGPNEYKFDVTPSKVVLRINETPQAEFTRFKKQQ